MNNPLVRFGLAAALLAVTPLTVAVTVRAADAVPDVFGTFWAARAVGRRAAGRRALAQAAGAREGQARLIAGRALRSASRECLTPWKQMGRGHPIRPYARNTMTASEGQRKVRLAIWGETQSQSALK